MVVFCSSLEPLTLSLEHLSCHLAYIRASLPSISAIFESTGRAEVIGGV